MDFMNFDAQSFTHITCLYFTIYYIKDKTRLFKNCYDWLKPGGYMVLHLVNRNMFDPILNLSEKKICMSGENSIIMLILWAVYMSFVHIGQTWYGYGWEIELLENGFLAIFLCPLLDGRPFSKRPHLPRDRSCSLRMEPHPGGRPPHQHDRTNKPLRPRDSTPCHPDCPCCSPPWRNPKGAIQLDTQDACYLPTATITSTAPEIICPHLSVASTKR